MLKTLVLLRMRCGCLDTEVEEGGEVEDSVWTLKRQEHLFIINEKRCKPNDWTGEVFNKYRDQHLLLSYGAQVLFSFTAYVYLKITIECTENFFQAGVDTNTDTNTDSKRKYIKLCLLQRKSSQNKC